MDSGIELSLEREIARKKTTVSLGTQLAFGMGHVFNDICSSIWFSYLLIFLHLVIELENWQAGFLLLLGQISDAVANPIIGYFSDKNTNTHLLRYGKRKAWHLFGTILLIATFPFTLLPCLACVDNTKTIQLIYYSCFVIVFQFGWAAVQNSHLSLIPELSNNENDRTKLAAARYCFTVISNLLVYVVSWIAFASKNIGKPISSKDGYKFGNIMWCGLFIGILTSIIFQLFVKEKQTVKTRYKNVDCNCNVDEKLNVCATISNLQYCQTAVLYMSSMLFVNMGQVFIPLYLHETLKMNASSLAIVPLIIYVGSLFTALFIKRVNRSLGRKNTYIIGAFIGLTACVWIFLRSHLATYVSYEIYIVALVFGIASCIVQVTNLGISADIIDSKTSNSAFVYGLMTLADKLSSGIAIFLIENLKYYYTNEDFYQNVVTITCSCANILATIFVIILLREKTIKKKMEYIQLP